DRQELGHSLHSRQHDDLPKVHQRSLSYPCYFFRFESLQRVPLVTTLCVVTQARTLCVLALQSRSPWLEVAAPPAFSTHDAERRCLRRHAERGNEKFSDAANVFFPQLPNLPRRFSTPQCKQRSRPFETKRHKRHNEQPASEHAAR